MSNAKNAVPRAADELFGDKDPSAVDRWVAADYRQHSALAADGPEALRGLVAGLGKGRPPNTAACQALAKSAGADSGCGQRPMSVSHWLVVRGG